MKIIGASAVCEALLREGVDVIFGHPGGAILPFYDSLWHYPQLRHILVRHEQAAAHAAESYARLTGKVGVCVATSGPGATNLMTGLAAAKMDSTPIVAITGQVARPFMGTEAFQECDTVAMSTPVVKKAFLVMKPEDIGEIFKEAFRIAREGRPGPVLIDLPKDVQAEAFDYDTTNQPKQDISAINSEFATDIDRELEEHLKEAADLLNQSKKPLLIVGRGIHASQAWDELQAFAEKINAPVLNTLHGVSAFSRHHRLAYGMLGMHGMYWSNIATTEADLIFGIGMRFDDRVIGKPGTFGPNAKIIHLDIEASQINKNVKADVGLVADVKQALSFLADLVE